MSDAKLQAARELIQAKNYEAARAVLVTMPNDPTAVKWLAKLDRIAPAVTAPATAPSPRRRIPLELIIILIALTIFIGIVVFAEYQANVQEAADIDRSVQGMKRQFCDETYTIYSTAWQNCVNDR